MRRELTTWTNREPLPKDVESALKDFPPLTQTLLFARGITSQEEAEHFFNPNYELDILDPFLLKDMERTVERILRAISENTPIVIFGDYDADGIPGAAILDATFREIGVKNYKVHIPHRHRDGYSLNMKAIEQFGEEGVKVLITVDCGITDVEEVARAGELGIDVIITDHHLPQKEIPKAFAIINAKQEDDTYPFKHLSGAGTAFKLAQAILARGNWNTVPGWEKWLLDLAAISTVCDMVPLVGENRAMAHFGLRVLPKTRRPGLVTLLRRTRLNTDHLSEDDLAFTIGPRINIASRMAHGEDAFKLLSTQDWGEARSIVDHLEKKITERKGVVKKIMKGVEKTVASFKEMPDILILGERDWHLGVISLAANKLLEQYNRPICLWALAEGGDIKGSFRSDGSVDMLELFEAAGGKDFFNDFGGHKLSGGFSLSGGKEEQLKERLETAYDTIRREINPIYHLDGTLTADQVSFETWKEVARFAPFGMDNPKPRFILPGIAVSSIRGFGAGGIHTEIVFSDSQGRQKKGIFFFCAPNTLPIEKEGSVVTLVGTLEKSAFGHSPEIRLRLEEVRAT